MNIFNLSLQLCGFPIDKAILTLSKIQNYNERDFNIYINNRKQAIVNYHLQNNSYYQNLVKDSNMGSWEAIPIMTKRNLQVPLPQRLSNKYTTKNVYVNKTSGSSGDPFIFAKDKFCHALTWAIIQNRFGWFDLDFNVSKQARFYGIPLDKKGYYKERFKDSLSKRVRFSVFDLSDSAFENNLKKFKKNKFDYINGYTSVIVQFAKFLKKKNILLNSICPTLKACVVTSEMLFEKDKQLMESQFGVPIINEYGASELDVIAFQSPSNEWLVNSETLYVEILDENNKILPLGEEGRVVVTSLYNKAHPFIRYDIGDTGILSIHGSTQRPVLKKLSGRSNDTAILPSGKKAAGLTFYYITKSIIEDEGSVKEFIIVQTKLDTFKVLYSSDEELANSKKEIIKGQMETYLENGLTIIFEKHDQIKRLKNGKLRQFSSLINQTN
ncbi:MAG: phenylacetate--CoA ligase family protein [Flavobacteriaceae bacterium]|nr:phenylacetate--CoA ligase family protein [Flavobacteriaceae bacterium]